MIASGVFGGILVATACGDDAVIPETSADAGPDGSPESSLPSDAGSTPPVDAASDAEEIVDGGGLPPEDDGGTTDDDGGFDGGPSCEPLTPDDFVETTCSALAPKLGGGALTTTSYRLERVVVLGSPTFCGNSGQGGAFESFEHRGALKVTASSATTATFELLDQYRKAAAVAQGLTTVRYDVGVSASGAILTYTPQDCSLKQAPANAGYTATILQPSGKRGLVLRLPYGPGKADYTFVEP